MHGELGFGNWGLYSAFPIMFTFSGEPNGSVVGNLEVGGSHRWDLDGSLSLVSHLGIVIPTAKNDEEKNEIRMAGSTAQLGDYYVRSVPDLFARFARLGLIAACDRASD